MVTLTKNHAISQSCTFTFFLIQTYLDIGCYSIANMIYIRLKPIHSAMIETEFLINFRIGSRIYLPQHWNVLFVFVSITSNSVPRTSGSWSFDAFSPSTNGRLKNMVNLLLFAATKIISWRKNLTIQVNNLLLRITIYQ